jgi:hypothetical protein
MCSLILGALEEEYSFEQDEHGNWIALAHGGLYNPIILDGGVRLHFWMPLDIMLITISCGSMPTSMKRQLMCCPGQQGEQLIVVSARAFETDGMSADRLIALPDACMPDISDTSTGSSAAMSRIRAWLDICTTTHTRCKRGDGRAPLLPTRVLNVGEKESKMSYLVRGKNRRGEYATLSHCWGGPNHRMFKTTDETLLERERGIDDEELPMTFRDAVQVCRAVGLKFLWIDSLCIIQDQAHHEDWTKEAPKMGHTYGNSMLTIAASDAAHSNQGCFRDRRGLLSWPCSILLFGQQRFVSRDAIHYEFWGNAGDTIDRVPSLPLNNRAWVLQEQILSQRSLLFTNDRLVWCCTTMSTNEKFPMGMDLRVQPNPDPPSDHLHEMHCILNAIEQNSSYNDPYACWDKIVQAFTARNLTFQDDRLPAIAGIAKRFATITNDTYHAGLWRRDLLNGMLWYSKSATAKETRAPSWSWASVNCEIASVYLGPDAIPLLEIVEVVDPPTCTEHPFGATSMAMLRISGVLLPVKSARDKYGGGLGLAFTQCDTGSSHAEYLQSLYLDELGLEPAADAPWFCSPVCVRRCRNMSSVDNEAESYEASWKRSLESIVDRQESFRGVLCLVLQAVRGRQDTYTRVGICVTNKYCKIGRINLRQCQTLTII